MSQVVVRGPRMELGFFQQLVFWAIHEKTPKSRFLDLAVNTLLDSGDRTLETRSTEKIESQFPADGRGPSFNGPYFISGSSAWMGLATEWRWVALTACDARATERIRTT